MNTENVQRVSSDNLRRNWRNYVDEVTHGTRVYVLRWGKPAAVLVPVEWYEKAKAAIGGGDQ